MSQHSGPRAGAMDPSRWPSGAAASPSVSPPAAGGSAMTVAALLITVASVLLFFAVFAFVFVCLLYYCINSFFDGRPGAEASPSGSRRRRGGAVVGAGAARGVDPELLRSLPVTVYRAPPVPKEDAVECAVCLAGLEDGEEARFLPRCGHGFHAECVDMWLSSHTTCPLCRLTVAKPDVPPRAPALLALVLPPVPAEPANYGSSRLPPSVLLGVSDHQGAVNAPAPSTDRVGTTTAMLAIEIPESATPTPSPASARLRSIRRLWSIGRQGAGSSSCSCGADVEQGISVTIDIAVAEGQQPSEAAADGATRVAAA